MNATAILANWVATAAAGWPSSALDGARRAFLDTVGCILLGSRDEVTQRAQSAVARWGTGTVAVIGTQVRPPAPWAALVNGAAAHARDYDDVSEPALSHVSAALVPALLALAEERRGSGAACLDAYLVGIEVMSRLGEAVNLTHYHRGWHTTLTLGAPAAAAACARLMGLDAGETQAALSLATSMAGGSKRQFGTMAKPLHAGLAAHNGVLAAQLAAAGVTAASDVFEGKGGFYDLFAGPEAPGLPLALSRLGNPVAMCEHGIWFKLYPCCASAHRSVDALLQLRERHWFTAEDVAEIDALVPEIAASNLMYHAPRDEMEARFSLHYALACALFDGQLTLTSFQPGAIHRPTVRRLLSLVHMRPNPDLPGTAPTTGGAEPTVVTVRLKGGQVFACTVTYPRGHAKQPLSDAELAGKFLACAGTLLPEADSKAALAVMHKFDSLATVEDLTGHLRR